MATQTKDAWGNPLKYMLKQAYKLVSRLTLDPITSITSTFIRKYISEARGEVVWPILPFKSWQYLGYPYPATTHPAASPVDRYVGISVEPPAPPPPDPPPPPEQDVTKPVVTAFTVATTVSTKDIPITELTATDNDSVLGYQITLTSDEPEIGDGWYETPPSRFPVPDWGQYDLYAWAIDPSGNISSSFKRTVTAVIPPDPIPPDPPPLDPPPTPRVPVITEFTMEPTASSPTVPIISFIGSSYVSIVGYMITENATVPQLNDTRWKSQVPTDHLFSTTNGTVTAHAWVKDRANQISSPATFEIAISSVGVPTIAGVSAGYIDMYDDPWPTVDVVTPYYYPYWELSKSLFQENLYHDVFYSWNRGRTTRGVLNITEEYNRPKLNYGNTERRYGFSGPVYSYTGGYTSQPQTPIFCDDGRVVLCNSFTEADQYIGVPDIYELINFPNKGFMVGDEPALIPPRGRPLYNAANGRIFYTDGESGCYIGSNKIIYEMLFPVYLVMFGDGNFADEYLCITDAPTVPFPRWVPRVDLSGNPRNVPPNFYVGSSRFASLTSKKDWYDFNDRFDSLLETIRGHLFTRGRRPRAASTYHTSSFDPGNPPNLGVAQSCLVGWVQAICRGTLPSVSSTYADVELDGVLRVHYSYACGQDFMVYNDQMGDEPVAWSHFPSTTRSGVYDIDYYYLAKDAELDLYLPLFKEFVYCGGTNILARVGGWEESDMSTFFVDCYTGTPSNPPSSTVRNYFKHTYAGRQYYPAYSTDGGLTWTRVTSFPAPLDHHGAAVGFASATPLNGGNLATFVYSGNIYKFNFDDGSITALEPLGYDRSGEQINTYPADGFLGVQLITLDASDGNVLFVKQVLAGEYNAILPKLYVSSGRNTINTYGPPINSISLIRCMRPDLTESFTVTSYEITGETQNTIIFQPPLPEPDMIMEVTCSFKNEGKRLLMMSDFGNTVYDAGWVENTWDRSLIVFTFGGGGFDPRFNGDIAYPYTPPVIEALTQPAQGFLGQVVGYVDDYKTIAVYGGVFPYIFELTNGAIPDGMELTSAGYISGKATSTGLYYFEIKVTDARGVFCTGSYSLEVK